MAKMIKLSNGQYISIQDINELAKMAFAKGVQDKAYSTLCLYCQTMQKRLSRTYNKKNVSIASEKFCEKFARGEYNWNQKKDFYLYFFDIVENYLIDDIAYTAHHSRSDINIIPEEFINVCIKLKQGLNKPYYIQDSDITSLVYNFIMEHTSGISSKTNNHKKTWNISLGNFKNYFRKSIHNAINDLIKKNKETPFTDLFKDEFSDEYTDRFDFLFERANLEDTSREVLFKRKSGFLLNALKEIDDKKISWDYSFLKGYLYPTIAKFKEDKKNSNADIRFFIEDIIENKTIIDDTKMFFSSEYIKQIIIKKYIHTNDRDFMGQLIEAVENRKQKDFITIAAILADKFGNKIAQHIIDFKSYEDFELYKLSNIIDQTLKDCTLYLTLEPNRMDFSQLLGLNRIVIGVINPKYRNYDQLIALADLYNISVHHFHFDLYIKLIKYYPQLLSVRDGIHYLLEKNFYRLKFNNSRIDN